MENRCLGLLGGIGLGAGLMFFLDTQQGRARRALVRDKLFSYANRFPDSADVVRRDVRNRARGLVAGTRSIFSHEPVDDRVLGERVRSRMGRVVSHPGAIEVSAKDGRVTVSGPILADEVARLMSCVWSVPGVRDVENRLEMHQTAGNVSDLQGDSRRTGASWEVFQDNWSPAMRLAVGTAGAALVGYGLTREAPEACLWGTLGLCLAARAITNADVGDWLKAGERALESVLPEGGVAAEPAMRWGLGEATAPVGAP